MIIQAVTDSRLLTSITRTPLPSDVEDGEELLSMLVRLSTERVLQEALEQEQGAVLGRARYKRGTSAPDYRNGYEDGAVKTAEGGLRVKGPQLRGREERYRSALWSQMARTSTVLKRLMVEMYGGGMAQRDMEYS